MFTDGASFKVVQAESCAPMGRIFYKDMEVDFRHCCPYENKDCSCNLKNDDEVGFYIFFYFESPNPSIKFVKCTTGGALVIGGTRAGYYAECFDANGVYTKVPLEEGPKPDYYYYSSFF